jgi:ribosomal protein S18 acetylase RimI-like enzyme
MEEPGVSIKHYTPGGAFQLQEPILAVYLASHHDLQHDSWFLPAQFWRRLVELYAPSRDFHLVAAWQGQSLIGYAFGSPNDNSAGTWEMVRQELPDVPIPDEEVPVYIFREFAVHPAFQGKGYGHMLHDALLRTRPEPLARLLVRPDNPAKAIYRHWGWRVIGMAHPFAESPVFDVMALPLPLA